MTGVEDEGYWDRLWAGEEPWPVWTSPDCEECGARMKRLPAGVTGWRCPTAGCRWGEPVGGWAARGVSVTKTAANSG